MEEKRRCHRLHIELPASFVVPGSENNIATATILDLSAIGICFSSKEKLKVGQELSMQTMIPSEQRVTVKVKVVWVKEVQVLVSNEYRVGVKIVEPMTADESKFVKFYAKKLLNAYPKEKK